MAENIPLGWYMRTRGKIEAQYFDAIVAGDKLVDYRQLETHTIVCEDTGRTATFEVAGVKVIHNPLITDLAGVHFSSSKPLMVLELGERIDLASSKERVDDEVCTPERPAVHP